MGTQCNKPRPMRLLINTHLAEERKSHRWSQKEVAEYLGTTQHNVSRWERGVTRPGPYFRTRLCTLFGKSAEELGFTEGSQQASTAREEATPGRRSTGTFRADRIAQVNAPSPLFPCFIELAHLFSQAPQPSCTQPGGSRFPVHLDSFTQTQGNSQSEASAPGQGEPEQEQERYTYILWIDASSEESLISSFTVLAKSLPALAGSSETNPRKLIAVVKRWLEQCEQNWLLIFDNAREFSLILEYCPRRGNGSLLWIPRARAFAGISPLPRVG